jgi:hypothetical protein
MSRPLPIRSAVSASSSASPGAIPPPKPTPLALLEQHILRGQLLTAPASPPRLAISDDGRGVYTFPEGSLAPPTDFFRFGPRG